MHFDWTFSFRDIVFLLAMAFAFGKLYTRVSNIETKLDSFITKDTVGALKEGADREHDSIRREINGITQRVIRIEERQ